MELVTTAGYLEQQLLWLIAILYCPGDALTDGHEPQSKRLCRNNTCRSVLRIKHVGRFENHDMPPEGMLNISQHLHCCIVREQGIPASAMASLACFAR